MVLVSLLPPMPTSKREARPSLAVSCAAAEVPALLELLLALLVLDELLLTLPALLKLDALLLVLLATLELLALLTLTELLETLLVELMLAALDDVDESPPPEQP